MIEEKVVGVVRVRMGSRMEAERPGRRDEDVAACGAASCGCCHRFRGHSGADTLVLLHCNCSSYFKLHKGTRMGKTAQPCSACHT